MIWFTSDHHFGHANVIKYCNRPFDSVEEMDDELIDRWNSFVGQNDRIYHLGDFTLGGGSQAADYFRRLNGKITVLANFWHHDKRWLRDLGYISMAQTTGTLYGVTGYITNSGGSVEILPPVWVLEYDRMEDYPLPIVMSHYPFAEWDRKHYGAIHLHGHSHGNHPAEGRMMDVGVDSNSFFPVSLDTILARFA